MDPLAVNQVCLREVSSDDLPRLYEFNLDPESNRLAATNPRGADAFAIHWNNVLADAGITARAIYVGDQLAGSISVFQRDGLHLVGYWVGREFWGRGIASRALELLLAEVPVRPLYAQVASDNRASLRVLQKCGFVIRSIQASPADERNLACDEAFLVLE
ncbi:MAG: GNAT family N-acetyltransferase [Pirellulales bacterium]